MRVVWTAIFAVFLLQTALSDIIIRDVVIEYSGTSTLRGITSVLAISDGMIVQEDEYSRRIERSLNEIRKRFPVDFASSWFFDAYDGRTVVFVISSRPYYTINGADIGIELELYDLVCKNLSTRIIVSENVQGAMLAHAVSERFVVQTGIRFYDEREAWEQILPSRSIELAARYTPAWWARFNIGTEMYQIDNDPDQRSIVLKNGFETSTTTRNQFNRKGWFVHLSNETVVWKDIQGSNYSYSSLSAGAYLPWKRTNLDVFTKITNGKTYSNHFPMTYPFSQRFFKGDIFQLDGAYVFCEITSKFYLTEKVYMSFFIHSLHDSSSHEVDYGTGFRVNYVVTMGGDYAIKSGRFHFGFIAYSF